MKTGGYVAMDRFQTHKPEGTSTMSTKKKYPEFELPPILVEAFTQAVGPKRMASTSSRQRALIQQLAQDAAAKLGDILEQPHAPAVRIDVADRPD